MQGKTKLFELPKVIRVTELNTVIERSEENYFFVRATGSRGIEILLISVFLRPFHAFNTRSSTIGLIPRNEQNRN